MTDGTLSISRYIEAPTDRELRIDAGSESVLAALGGFLPVYANPFFVQWRNIKRASAALIDSGALPPFSVHLTAELRARAYATDGGQMYFSLGALLTRSSAVTLTVFCHELSHLWLSGRDFYPELKRLNKEFLTEFSSLKAAYLMSPIEVYASSVSLSLLEALSASLPEGRKRKKLERLILKERCKLELLISEISMLKIQDGIDSK